PSDPPAALRDRPSRLRRRAGSGVPARQGAPAVRVVEDMAVTAPSGTSVPNASGRGGQGGRIDDDTGRRRLAAVRIRRGSEWVIAGGDPEGQLSAILPFGRDA